MSSNDDKFVHDDRFDGLYLNVAQQTQGIEPLLDTVFSFLRRKTDFFQGPSSNSSSPVDPTLSSSFTDKTELAVQKVHQVLQKHVDLYKKEQQQQQKKKTATDQQKRSSRQQQKQKQGDGEQDVLEIPTTGVLDVSAPSSAALVTPEIKEIITTGSEQQPASASTQADTVTKEDLKPQDATTSLVDGEGTNSTNQTSSRGPPPIGNGGTVDGKYVWTQTLQEVTVNVPVPNNTRGKDLNVVIAKKHLKVTLKQGQQTPLSSKVLVDGALCKSVVIEDSFWTVEDGNRLAINLQKLNGMEWWDCVCLGDPKINVQDVQPENSKLADLDGDTRQTVEKMMYDQRQRALGLPTSEQEEKLTMLEKFKQQHPELDFSNAKIS